MARQIQKVPPEQMLNFFRKCSLNAARRHVGNTEVELEAAIVPAWPIFGSQSAMIVLGGKDIRCYFKVFYSNETITKIVDSKRNSNSNSTGPSPREFMREFTNLVAGHAKNELSNQNVRVGISTPVTSPALDEVFFNHRKSVKSELVLEYWNIQTPQGSFTCSLSVDFIEPSLLVAFSNSNPNFQSSDDADEFFETDATCEAQENSVQLELNRAVQSIGSIIGILESMRDTSENFVDQIPDSLIILDSLGTVVKLNAAAANIFGTNQDQALLLNLNEFIDKNASEALLVLLDKSKNNSVFLAEQTIAIKPNGTGKQLIVEWKVWPLEKSTTHPLDVFCLYGRDVTDLIERTQEKVRLDGELEQARILQDSVSQKLPKVPNVQMVSCYQPASQTGGDWISSQFESAKNVLRICVGDVTGHGFASSLVTTAVHGAQIAFDSLESLFQKSKSKSFLENEEFRLRTLVPALNRTVLEIGRNEKYLTLCLFSLDLKSGDFAYASLGHPPIFHFSAKTKQTRKVRLSGSRLGRSPKIEFKVLFEKLEKGDRLFLYTDGIFENQNLKGETLSEKAVLKLIGDCKDVFEFERTFANMMTATWRECALEDDISYLFLEYMGD